MVSDSWRARLAKIDRCPVCGAWRYAGRCPAAVYANHRNPGKTSRPD